MGPAPERRRNSRQVPCVGRVSLAGPHSLAFTAFRGSASRGTGMTSRAWAVVGAVIPAALWLAACNSDPAAPQDGSNSAAPPGVSGPAFHVIANTCDFMTGGGFLGKPKSKTFTWGMHAGKSEDGTVFGHLNLIDHVNGLHYKSVKIK